jgi:uncharacterized RDD family membrane protein YckC
MRSIDYLKSHVPIMCLALLIFYFAAFGPIMATVPYNTTVGVPSFPTWVRVVYHPIFWISHKQPFLGYFLGRYAGFWMNYNSHLSD